MAAKFEQWVLVQWQKKGLWAWLMAPLSLLFCAITWLRRWAYRSNLKQAYRAPIPVVVVGNLTVGGTGKSPLVAYLAKQLSAAGWQPVIISRGYKGGQTKAPQLINEASKADRIGDEARMLMAQTRVPVVVGADRAASVRYIIAEQLGDVVISDDGFQHFRLARDVQLLVVDGARGYGNGWCLPSGPLREPKLAEKYADAVVINGGPAGAGQFAMQMQLEVTRRLSDAQEKPLTAFSGMCVHALAGIGHPQRFFTALYAEGLSVVEHPFPDHHAYTLADLPGDDELPILVTEKDAVKINDLSLGTLAARIWVVPVTLQLDEALWPWLSTRLERIKK